MWRRLSRGGGPGGQNVNRVAMGAADPLRRLAFAVAARRCAGTRLPPAQPDRSLQTYDVPGARAGVAAMPPSALRSNVPSASFETSGRDHVADAPRPLQQAARSL
jgi:hypothetical protein